MIDSVARENVHLNHSPGRIAGIDYGTLCERILASAFADGGR